MYINVYMYCIIMNKASINLRNAVYLIYFTKRSEFFINTENNISKVKSIASFFGSEKTFLYPHI